eukprot:1143616-Pelagomonas_calceolata.AAC.2
MHQPWSRDDSVKGNDRVLTVALSCYCLECVLEQVATCQMAVPALNAPCKLDLYLVLLLSSQIHALFMVSKLPSNLYPILHSEF